MQHRKPDAEKDPAAVALGRKRWQGISEAEKVAHLTKASHSRKRQSKKRRQEIGRLGGLKASANKRARLQAEAQGDGVTPLSGD